MMYEMRKTKPGPTLLPIFNLPHHIGMVWEELTFDDAVWWCLMTLSVIHSGEIDWSTARCYNSDLDSNPCSQGHIPRVLTNWANSPPKWLLSRLIVCGTSQDRMDTSDNGRRGTVYRHTSWLLHMMPTVVIITRVLGWIKMVMEPKWSKLVDTSCVVVDSNDTYAHRHVKLVY